MPSDIMKKFFFSSKPAQIENLVLRPKQHPAIKDTLLSVQRGQAEVYFLKENSGDGWLIKDFHVNKTPDLSYLEDISSVLPEHKAFRCGTERKVLSKNSHKNYTNMFYSADLANWLDGTVLMPQIEGVDWACLIDRIRSGEITLTEPSKFALCKNLAQTIKTLEHNGVSHRDLSNGNIFINPKTYEVSLIDFDGVYHSSLSMPAATTAGSEGYTAPFVDLNSIENTFCQFADRFAMTALCVEFLILTKDSPYFHEGGIFNQQDIYNRKGKTIVYATRKLNKNYPEAANLFNATMNTESFADCPSPDDWIDFCNDTGFCYSIHDLSLTSSTKSSKSSIAITLPDNPWKKKGNLNGTNSKPDHGHKSSDYRSNGHFDHHNNTGIDLPKMESKTSAKNTGPHNPGTRVFTEQSSAFDIKDYIKKRKPKVSDDNIWDSPLDRSKPDSDYFKPCLESDQLHFVKMFRSQLPSVDSGDNENEIPNYKTIAKVNKDNKWVDKRVSELFTEITRRNSLKNDGLF